MAAPQATADKPTAAAPKAAAAKAAKTASAPAVDAKGTKYVVLIANGIEGFERYDTVTATSDTNAIAKAVTAKPVEGEREFVAIPERSFRRRKAGIVTTTKLKVA